MCTRACKIDGEREREREREKAGEREREREREREGGWVGECFQPFSSVPRRRFTFN